MVAASDVGWARPQNLTGVPVAASFMGAAWVAVALRVYTRANIVRCLGWDDITMLAVLGFFTVFCACEITVIRLTHTPEFHTWHGLEEAVNWLLVCEVFYLLSVTLLKISLGILYIRILPKGWQKRIVYLSMAVATVWYVVCAVFVIFQCGYPKNARVFLLRAIGGKCASATADRVFGYSQAAVTTITDFVYVALPLIIIRKAAMDTREKIIVSLILALGLVGSICSLVRFKFVGALVMDDPMNFFFNASNIGIWSTIEPGAGIVAASLATLRPLLKVCLCRTPTSFSLIKDGGRSSSHLPSMTRLSSYPPAVQTSSSLAGASDGFPQLHDVTPPLTSYNSSARGSEDRIWYGQDSVAERIPSTRPPFRSRWIEHIA